MSYNMSSIFVAPTKALQTEPISTQASLLPSPMARVRNYSQASASPGGRSFYTGVHKCTQRARAPITPALRRALAQRREEHRAEYALALNGAQASVHEHAARLREAFGGHSVEYYTQEILQRGRLERKRRKPSRWNAFLRQQINARNAGAEATNS